MQPSGVPIVVDIRYTGGTRTVDILTSPPLVQYFFPVLTDWVVTVDGSPENPTSATITGGKLKLYNVTWTGLKTFSHVAYTATGVRPNTADGEFLQDFSLAIPYP